MGKHLRHHLMKTCGYFGVEEIDRCMGVLEDLAIPESEVMLEAKVSRVNEVYHLAGNADWRWLDDHPEVAFRELSMANRVFGQCLKHEKPVVVASSALAWDVHTPSVYGLVKLAIEGLAAVYCGRGLKVAVARIFNVYGPGQEQAITYSSALVPDLIRKFQGAPEKVSISGCNSTRDFIFVEDVVSGLVASMGSLKSDSLLTSPMYNLGTGFLTSVAMVAALLYEFMDYAGEMSLDREGSSTFPAIVERRPPGWEPTVDLYEGLKRTVVQANS